MDITQNTISARGFFIACGAGLLSGAGRGVNCSVRTTTKITQTFLNFTIGTFFVISAAAAGLVESYIAPFAKGSFDLARAGGDIRKGAVAKLIHISAVFRRVDIRRRAGAVLIIADALNLTIIVTVFLLDILSLTGTGVFIFVRAGACLVIARFYGRHNAVFIRHILEQRAIFAVDRRLDAKVVFIALAGVFELGRVAGARFINRRVHRSVFVDGHAALPFGCV